MEIFNWGREGCSIEKTLLEFLFEDMKFKGGKFRKKEGKFVDLLECVL